MKSTGIVRRIDDLVRVVIPKGLRMTMGIEEGDPLEIFVDGPRIIFNKYEPACIFCNSADDVKNYKGKNICGQCLAEMKRP